MNILKKIQEYACRRPEQIAIRCGDSALTYGELWNYSDGLAAWFLQTQGDDRSPVAVYGHKDPWMLVCFLACVKAGRGYCPIDRSVPQTRVEMILQAVPSGVVLTTEAMTADAGTKQVLVSEELKALAEKKHPEVPETAWVSGKDTWYIIFTSGSTGTPKGVQISADCLNHYLDWSVGLGSAAEEKDGQVFLNQAPFSFDLSVMDLYTSLASGGTLYCLEKTVQSDYRLLMQTLGASNANVWVSTPSFAEVCLSEKSFSEELLPKLQVFLFCGETLGNRTVQKLQERFPKAAVVNTYGPTESTVAVTDVLVTPQMARETEPLPVGRAKPGTRIEIRDEAGTVLPDGEKGELVFTSITKEAFPLLRYRTRDICILSRKKCSCGRTHNKMTKPLGRSDDMLIVKGVNVFPSQIETVLMNKGYAANYQIIVDRVNNSDTIEVQVEMTPEMFSDSMSEVTAKEKELVTALKAMLGIYAKVTLVNPKTITRSEGKAVRVIDKRNLYK